MFETYYDSAEGLRVSYARALKELEKHGLTLGTMPKEERLDWVEFWNAHKDTSDTVNAQCLLMWLGY